MIFRLAGFWLLCMSSVFAGSAGPAISALRVLGDQPYASNVRLVELQGERGTPMPAEWRILLADSSARGGVRELCVINGNITSERTPLKGFQNVSEMSALVASEVTVDAGSLYQTAHEEATAARLAFHSLDYTLRANPSSGEPVWSLRLYDEFGSLAGTMSVSARNGAIVQSLQTPDGSPIENSHSKRVGGLIGKIVDFTETAARNVGNTTLRTFGTVQEFLVGERTIGPRNKE